MQDILVGESDGELNVHSRSRDPRARVLSALANRPFSMIGAGMFASFEGFFNGIKYHYDDPRRRRAFASSFGYAQRFGDEAQNEWVWWHGKRISSGSPEHRDLIKQAHRESIMQNPDRMQALIDSAGLVITHNIGTPSPPDSPYSHNDFCAELTEFREELLR